MAGCYKQYASLTLRPPLLMLALLLALCCLATAAPVTIPPTDHTTTSSSPPTPIPEDLAARKEQYENTQTTNTLASTTPSASPSPPVELTLANFQELISSGVWWIKYYSPYCHHCKSFAPTWLKVSQDLAATHPQLRFADVNCVAQGDLCSKMGIRAYPMVNLYRNGKQVDQIRGARKETFLKKYINDQLDLISKIPTSNGLFPAFPASEEIVNQKYPGSFVQVSPDDDDEESTSAALDKYYNYLVQSEPNFDGESVVLDSKEFTRRVTATRDSWFINFYSPSSPASLAVRPIWRQLARKAKGRLNIGEVNCDVEKQLCKEAGVKKSTPLLKFFASSIHSEYRGLMGLGDLLQFLTRAVDARNPRDFTFKDYTALKAKPAAAAAAAGGAGAAEAPAESNDVTLLYLYDKTASKEDFQAFEKLAVSLVGTVNVAKSNDTQVAEALGATYMPALYAISADKTTLYLAKTPHEMRDHAEMLKWAQENRFSLVPQLSPFNFREVFDQKIVVLGILDGRDTVATSSAITELKACARELQEILQREEEEELHELRKKKQLKVDEAKDRGDEKAEHSANKIRVEVSRRQPVGVAWIDAVFWERWIKQRYGSVQPAESDLDDDAVAVAAAVEYTGQQPQQRYAPRVIINHEPRRVFWDRSVDGSVLRASRTQILETLDLALQPRPKLRPVRMHNSVIGFVMQGYYNLVLGQHYIIVGGLIMLSVLSALYHYRSGGNSSSRSTGSSGTSGHGGSKYEGEGVGRRQGHWRGGEEGSSGGMLGKLD